MYNNKGVGKGKGGKKGGSGSSGLLSRSGSNWIDAFGEPERWDKPPDVGNVSIHNMSIQEREDRLREIKKGYGLKTNVYAPNMLA